MKKFLTGLAIFAASLGYGCVAHAQCPGGVCPVQQATYATPVRQVIYNAAQTITQATAPKQCPTKASEHPIIDGIRERREQRKEQRQRCR